MTFQDFYRMPLPCRDARVGNHAIESIPVSEEEALFHRLRSKVKGADWLGADAGVYRRLIRIEPHAVVMSNTKMEARTNWRFVRKAHGRVVINGLGLGWLPCALAEKPEVHTITVIERESDVIEMVAPTLPKKVRVIQADAMTYRPEGSYDCVWHDIWDTISLRNLPQMIRLMTRYKNKAKWQGCWSTTMMRVSAFRDKDDFDADEYAATVASIRFASSLPSGQFGEKLATLAKETTSAFAESKTAAFQEA